MSTHVRNRARVPFDFVDGLKIKGIDLSSVDGAKLIGTYVSPTDTEAKPLQTWIDETIAAVESLKALVGGGSTNATSPDRPLTDSSQSNANTKFVQELMTQKLTALLDGAVAPMATLKALAAAINNDPNFYTTIANALAGKATLFDVQSDACTYAQASGTVNAITATFSPAVTTLTDGMVLRVRSLGANTGAVTFTPNSGSIPAYPVQKGGSTPLVAGDISMGAYPIWLQYDQAALRWVMINPSFGVQTRYATEAETVAGLIDNLPATPAGIKAAVAAIVGSAPAALDTITELAAAINNDPNFATTIANALALKAPLASPAFTGTPTAPTQVATDSSSLIATTAFVKQALQLATQSGGVPNASTTVSGVSRYATVAESKTGSSNSTVVTPEGLAAIAIDFVRKDSPTFAVPPQIPTPASGSNDTQLANTKFVWDLYSSIPNATTALPGRLRFSTVSEAVAGLLENVGVTPKGLAAVMATIPTVGQATTAVKGIARLATSSEALGETNSEAVITPSTAKLMIDKALGEIQPPPVFVSPVLSGSSTLYQQKPYQLSMSATPVGSATSITSFTVSIVNSLTGVNALSETTTVAASNGSAVKTINLVANHSNSTLTITVTATDNTGKTSEVATKTVQAVTVTVNAPTFSSPTANQTNLSKTLTLAVGGFGVSADNDVHSSTTWKIFNETLTTVVYQSLGNTTDKTSHAVPAGYLNSGTKYVAEATFNAGFYGASASARVTFTVAAALVGELQKLTFPDAAAVGKAYGFGSSIAISADGTYVVVGAPGTEQDGLTNQGQAHIFIRQGSSYVHQAALNMDEVEGGIGFGFAVSIDSTGPRCAVTSNTANELYGGEGHCQIFVRSGTTWTREFKILPPVNSATGVMESWISFGHAVSLNGDATTIAVAAPQGNQPSGTGVIDDAGYVYIYTRSGTTWSLQQRLVAADQKASDQFGYSLGLSTDGNTIAIGNVYREQVGKYDTGSGAIFKRTGTTWTLVAELFAPGATNSDWMGFSAAISGNGLYAAFGAVYDDEGASNAGAVHVYFFNGTAWVHQSKIICSSPVSNSLFGSACSLNSVGDKLLVGASADNSSGTYNAGKAILFKRTGTTWAQTNTLSASTVKAGMEYGSCVSLSQDGNYGVVGARLETNTSAPNGSVYMLTV